MPQAPELINVVDAEGNAAAVPADQIADALARGYRIEGAEQEAARLGYMAKEETYGGISGAAAAGVAGAARGLTFGASDVLLGAAGMGEELQGLRDVNQTASTVGEIGGAVVGAFVAPGSLLARTPAGLAARAGARIAEGGAGASASLGARAARGAAGAAFEGAAQNAGAYISDVALGDRELSADGFMGAMGQGALWGGVAGGSLALAGGGLTAARRLFPKQEITREAVQVAEDVARREVAGAVADGDALAVAARDRLRQIRADRAALDLDTKVKLDTIAIREAEALAASRVAKAEIQTERAAVALEKAKAPAAKRTRKALQDEAIPPTAPQAEAVAPAVTEDATSLLERQLLGTKAQIDAGETLASLNAKRAAPLKATHVEDALNAEIARVDPEAAKLVNGLKEIEDGRTAIDGWLGKYSGGAVGKFERQQAARDWAEQIRPKDAGYYSKLPQDSQRPGFLEGNAAAPRGRQSVWRGTEEERALADARTLSKVTPEDQASSADAIEAMFARRERRGIAEDIAADRAAPTTDEQVQTAIRSKVDSIDDDIAESAGAIGRYEAASAELADTLGMAAPPTASARAAGLREAQQATAEATTDAAGRALADAERAAQDIATGQAAAPTGKLGGAVGKAQDVATAYEGARELGIDLPDPRSMPVIGPLLGAYLKARFYAKAFGRFGGKVADTAETTIAKKSAMVKQRINAAVDKMLEVSSVKVSAAAGRSGGVAAILGHKLFDDGERSKPDKARPYTSSPAPTGSIGELYLARSDEVTRAMVPGAIERAVRARVKTSDPTIVDAIVAAQARKLEFLDSKMPKPSEPPVPTGPRMPWIPSKAEISQWGRYVQAAEDPVGIIEAAADGGHVSVEAVETLRSVYPKLYAEAQQRILTKVMDHPEQVPYARRVQLSVMFDMPFDGSQTPEGAAFLQQTYQPAPPPQQPQPQMGAPTITADVGMSQRANPETRA
jgi:hypothetical protein